MGNLVNIMSMIGVERTLVIACGDYGLGHSIEFNDRVFVLFLPDNMLQRHDYVEKGKIQSYVENKNCTQIVFIGSIEPELIKSIKENKNMHALRNALRFDLNPALIHNRSIISPAGHNQMLIEMHVISQCNALVDYYFIRERLQNRELDIRGIITGVQGQWLKTIYHNGYVYNDLLSLN